MTLKSPRLPDLERIVWQRETDTDWSAFEPIVWRDRLLVGDSGGNLFLLEPTDGSVAWQGSLDGGIRALQSEGDVLYVGTLPGTIYAYRPLLPVGVDAEPPASSHPG